MASRKEYEMLFQLSASANGSFSSTFSKAQQQFSAFQKQIVELGKTQGDISAYQKQQQAVESTQKKLEVLRQQYDNIQREIQETGEFSSDLENKLLSKQQQIDKTSASLDRQTQKLDEMGRELQEAGVDTSKLAEESDRLETEIADLRKQEEAAAEEANSFGKASADAFEAAGNALAAAGIIAGLKEIYEAYVECVNVAGDFEASLSNVEALSGATNEEMARLSDLAKELGATTKYTAKESADAMGYMAMAGWSAEQMIAGMPGVLQLAAASGEDLATVSDIVTDSLTAFGLSAADTNRYADILAATAANANTNVSMMGETFKVVAPLAGSLGYDVEDLAVATGLMANAGIKGSEAGTAMRSLLTRLAKPTKESADAMEALGLSLTDDEGRMYTFMEIMEQMRDSFSGLTREEKSFYAAELAGQRGMSALLNIVNASESDFEALSAAITDSTGAAQEMANIKMDNMVGQLTLLQSAWEACQTTVGEQFTPVLQELYGKLAGVLSQVNGYLKEHPGIIKAMTAFIGIAGGVVMGITAITAAIKVYKALNVASLFAGPAGAIMLAGVAVAGFVAAVIALNEATKTEADEARKLTETYRSQYDELQELKAEYEEAKSVYGENSDQARYLAWQIDELTKSYQSNKQTVKDYIKECSELNKTLNDDLDAAYGTFTSIGESEGTTLALVHRLQELASQTDKTVATQEEMKVIIDALNKSVPDLALNYEDVASGVTDVGASIEAIVKAQAAAERYQAAQEGMIKAFNAQYEAENQLKGLEENRNAAQERYTKAAEAYWDLYNRMTKYDTTGGAAIAAMYTDEYKEMTAAQEALKLYNEQMEETSRTLQTATDQYNEYRDSVVDYVEETTEATSATAAMEGVISLATDRVAELAEAYNKAYEAAYTSISGQYSLWDEAKEVAEKKTEDINKALGTQIEHWNDYNANLEKLRGRAGEIEGLSDVIASFADGSNESVAAIAGMASASDKDLKDMVRQWQDLQKAQSDTAATIAEFKVDFSTQMDELTQEIQDDIKALDLSADAAANGRATIQAFIDSAADMEDEVRRAYAKLGAAASSALGTASGNYGTVNTYGWMRGYATGTDYAAAGLALVGEYGPELVLMHGGEEVIDAARTRELLQQVSVPAASVDAIPDMSFGGSGGEYVVTFAPVYQFGSEMSGDEIESTLRAHDEELLRQFEELLAEVEDTKARRAYR